MKYHWRYLISLILVFSYTKHVFATIQLPSILGDNMVLQRGENVPIWGYANTNELITVSFKGQTQQTQADRNGDWKIYLTPMEASFNPATLKIVGENTVELKNILVGEVWLCTGQSNMQWTLAQSAGGEAAIQQANYPHIRFFNVNRKVAFKEKEGPLATWQQCSPETVSDLSGVGYFFGLEIYQDLNIPIGIINSSFGGSQAEAWTPRSYLQQHDDLRPCIEREKVWEVERPQVQKDFDQAIEMWKIAAKEAEEKGQKTPRQPRVPDALRPYRIAGSIYDNMIEPLIPFRLKGTLWYQGESNEERAEQYKLLLPTMIQAWRDRWGQGDFPFCVIQLPNFRAISDQPEDAAWSHLREAQRLTALNTSKTDLLTTIDLGEAADIHPTNKYDVGQRLAKWAMIEIYGQEGTWSGPMFKRAKIKRRKIVLHFDQVGKGLQICKGDTLKEFAIAGADQEWQWAKARIKGRKKVVVWSENISNPKAVRYAFNQNPLQPNLSNETGLPATPFRTDNWPDPTAGKK